MVYEEETNIELQKEINSLLLVSDTSNRPWIRIHAVVIESVASCMGTYLCTSIESLNSSCSSSVASKMYFPALSL
jgi:hypothetical protein